ncbi:MAG: hypothetical protein K6F09_05445 [Clostridiales bacterium]|nr:hypothetical protein [Clostridiales bacterium]
MSYLRDRTEELTSFQQSAHYSGKDDINTDVVMVYGISDSTCERIAEYKKHGYIIHVMVGIAWGGYRDYLFGQWDGKDHWDEAQEDRFGTKILHGPDMPYMVPTITFADYITEGLKKAVDFGAEAIHVEEPEFWDRGGYSEAFKREYKLFYREDWRPPYESEDARYRAAKLKSYLYRRTIDRVSSYLKEYALTKYGRVLRFYVPTHSLLNYTQWKIVSPEGMLSECPSLDGYIAQIWTGTSREPTPFDGVIKERTFETAYLEYGIMQELIKGTGRKMWFLHDPIEDNKIYTWENYKYNYLKTVVASLLHPKVNSYEVCPWPVRVFYEKYPRNSPDAKPIPADYATLLCSVFQTLGDMPLTESDNKIKTGVLLSDTALFQRDYSDSVIKPPEAPSADATVISDSDELKNDFKNKLFKGEKDERLIREYIRSSTFPSFYGLCLPMLKYGMPVRPVSLDNIRRYNGYLDDYDVLLLSYEFMKPEYPDINNALASWVKAGGKLIYVGDGSDPYHKIRSWWNSSKVKYPSAAEHLFEMLGISEPKDREVYSVGNGFAAVWYINPAEITYSKEKADEMRELFGNVVKQDGGEWNYKNSISIKRGPYIPAAVLDESISDEPLTLRGLFADMFDIKYKIITEKTLSIDENALLFDIEAIKDESLRVIGTSARIISLSASDNAVSLTVKGTEEVNTYTRLRVPFEIKTAEGKLESGKTVDIGVEYDAKSRTVLLSYDGIAENLDIILK